jgi:hypothetical protein
VRHSAAAERCTSFDRATGVFFSFLDSFVHAFNPDSAASGNPADAGRANR